MPTWHRYPSEMLPSFETWAKAFPEGQRAAADTPDRDGIPNLVKYVAGLAPGTPYSSAELFRGSTQNTPSNTVLILDYFKDPAAFGTSLYPIASRTLSNAPAAWSADGITTVDTGTTDADGRTIWRAVLTTETQTGFLRLKAEVE